MQTEKQRAYVGYMNGSENNDLVKTEPQEPEEGIDPKENTRKAMQHAYAAYLDESEPDEKAVSQGCINVEEDTGTEKQKTYAAYMDGSENIEEKTGRLGPTKPKENNDVVQDREQDREYSSKPSVNQSEIPLGTPIDLNSGEKDPDLAREIETLNNPNEVDATAGNNGTSRSSWFTSLLGHSTTDTTANNDAQNINIAGPTGPGAFSMQGLSPRAPSVSLRDTSERQSIHRENHANENHQPADAPSSNLAEAWPVSGSSSALQQATPHEEKDEEESNPVPQEFGPRERTLAWACLFVTIVLFVAGIGTVVAVTAINRATDTSVSNGMDIETITNPRFQEVQLIIEDVFGSDYFDDEPKQKALDWIVLDDPMLQQESGNLTDVDHIIQRYSAAAFYFQTSSKGSWQQCAPAIGSQRESCIYQYSPHYEYRTNRWLSGAHECTWMGISCSEKNITEIDIHKNGLNGLIPSELLALSHLEKLHLEGNNITGTIPDWFPRLGSLESVTLSKNILTGPIPEQLFSMERLDWLYIMDNQLTGTIPTEIGLFRGTRLSMNYNQLTGTLPNDLYTLSQLKWLWLGHNSITGTLSSQIWNMASLSLMILNHCDLSGSIPSQVGLLDAMQYVQLFASNLEGTIPEDLFNVASLEELDLTGNRLSGSISPAIGQLTNLNHLSLANNQITGTIPAELSLLNDLRILHVNGNRNLTGSIPELFCSNQLQNAILSSGWGKPSVVADCAPAASTGVPSVVCQASCCSRCCDVDTGICVEQ